MNTLPLQRILFECQLSTKNKKMWIISIIGIHSTLMQNFPMAVATPIKISSRARASMTLMSLLIPTHGLQLK